jgi:hypothetical protein
VTAPPDLPAFLLARLGEVEADARAAAEVNPPPWRVHLSRMGGDTGLVMGGETPANRYLNGALWDNEGADSLSMEPATAAHIARHDPARVLAECAAKRAIVDTHYASEPSDYGDFTSPPRCVLCGLKYPCWTLCSLAAVYADHPDFDPAWRV